MAFSLEIKRVLISDNLDSCCKEILEANGVTVDVKTKLTKEELLAEISVRPIILLAEWIFVSKFNLIHSYCRTTMAW